jgi:prolipoprotein diacylglyceryltransferase
MFSHFYFAQRWCRKLSLPRRAGLWLSACYLFGMAVGARILYDLLQRQFNPYNYLRPGYYFTDGLWGGPLAYLMLAAPFALFQGRRLIRTQSASDGRDTPESWEMSPRACAWVSDGSRGLKSAARGGAVRDLLDLMVLSLPMPMVLAKVACLFNGCCFGEPCNWSWCIVFPYGAEAPAGIARHPTQAYEIITLLFIWFVLVTLDRRRWHGLLTLWFGFLYGLGRPLTEFFRVPNERRPSVGFLSTSQAVCLAGAVVAVIALWFLRPPRRPFKPPRIKTNEDESL